MHTLLQCSLFLFLICFIQEGLGSEIIKGLKVRNNLMKYMASVQTKRGHICGGFLISEYFVMTAAHCDLSKTLTVVLGTHNMKSVSKSMRYRTKKCKHPHYNNETLRNDIMLLKLSRKAILGKHPIKPVPIPEESINLKADTKCTVAGWGSVVTGGGNVDELYATDVPILDRKECGRLWRDNLPANVICAGGSNSDKGFCQGDSGGPLVCNKMAVGIVSFNHNRSCDYRELPNIYTDLSKYLPWVRDIRRKKTC